MTEHARATESAPAAWDIGTGVVGYCWPAAYPRAVLLLQHGYAEYAKRFVENYNQLIPHLREMGISVFAFDARGHGNSPGAPGVTDLQLTVRDHVAARRMLDELSLPIFLLGHSMGGLITAASVLASPANVAGVILSSPGFARPGLAIRLLVNILARIKPGMGVVRPASPTGLSRNPEQVRRFVSDPQIYRGKVSALLAATGLEVAHAVRRRTPQWTAPTLLIHGSFDRFTNVEVSREFMAKIASDDRMLEVFEDGFHELLNDICAEKALRSVTTWLDQRLPVATSANSDARRRELTSPRFAF